MSTKPVLFLRKSYFTARAQSLRLFVQQNKLIWIHYEDSCCAEFSEQENIPERIRLNSVQWKTLLVAIDVAQSIKFISPFESITLETDSN